MLLLLLSGFEIREHARGYFTVSHGGDVPLSAERVKCAVKCLYALPLCHSIFTFGFFEFWFFL